MDHEIELRHLRYFLAVAKTLHFSRAAEQLGMAQPPLSQQIQRLEKLIGFALFERTTRGVKLTEVGEFLRERARDTLGKWEKDLEGARRLGRGEDGVVTVSFSGSVMLTQLPGAIEEFRRRFPRVELRLRELTTGLQQEALRSGEVDVAFLRDGVAEEGLQMQTLLEERFLAVLPAPHQLARRKAIAMQMLREEPFVLFSRQLGSLAFDRTVGCCEDAGFYPRIVQETPQWPTILRLAAAGLGVSLAPECVASLALPGVVFRRTDAKRMSRIDLAWRTSGLMPAAVQFLEVARAAFRKAGKQRS